MIPWEHAKIAEPGQWPDYTSDVDAIVNYGSMKIQKVPGIPLTTYTAALGGPGMTAYMALKEYADMKSVYHLSLLPTQRLIDLPV